MTRAALYVIGDDFIATGIGLALIGASIKFVAWLLAAHVR